ncbi:MAG: saccharopine dehydrogenase C-terminal domain-containing protein [Kiloniellales bacterium]|nr:saccharopine dehydrogenase C-terminal domain-containing protein [Kiloniellales bacterium]
MAKLTVLGAGKIGIAVAEFLADTGDYDVTLTDASQESLDRAKDKGFKLQKLDVEDHKKLAKALLDQDAVVSACPYYLNSWIAEAARDTRTHYFDLTEDVATTRAIRKIAEGADVAFMPQCGLAPGFIGIAGYDLARKFDRLEALRMRVGALPQFPSNSLKYNLTWSTDGVINEYCNPCEAIHEGRRMEVLPLEGHEEFALDGITYEAFNTSGGLGTLCETLDRKVTFMDYKTVRYPGHCEFMKMMTNELRLSQDRELFKEILERAVPMTQQDVVIIMVTASGERDGHFTQETFAKKVYGRRFNGQVWSAIQLTTAAGVCAAVDLLFTGKLPNRGFLRQETVGLGDFLENRFGHHYH